jgi:hypothetical protein
VALARCWSVESIWSLRRLGRDLCGSASLLWRIRSGSLLARAAALLRRLWLNSIVVRIFDFVLLVNGRLRVCLNYLGSLAAFLRCGRFTFLRRSAALLRLLDRLLLNFGLSFNCGGGLGGSAALLRRLDSDCSGLCGSAALLWLLGRLLLYFPLLLNSSDSLSRSTALLRRLSDLVSSLGGPSTLLGGSG